VLTSALARGVRGRGLRSSPPVWLLLWISLAYYIAAQSAFLIGTLSDRIFAPFWPPNAVLFCALLLNARDRWWMILGAAFPAHVLAETGVGMPPTQLLVAFATNCSLALLNSLTVQRFVVGPPWFGTLRKAAIYVLMTAGINPAVAALGGAFVPITGDGHFADYWIYWSNWYVGNALAALTFAPIILTWTEHDWRGLTAQMGWRQVEGIAFLFALLSVSILSLGLSVSAADTAFLPAILYLPLPIILWGSVRFGERGASGAILVLAVVSIWLTLNGPSPFADRTPEKSVLALQLFLIGIAVPVILLTAAVDQLREMERTTRLLAGSLLNAQDQERRRIARDLHDSTGQNLIAASLIADDFKELLPGSALTQFQKWNELIRESIRELRTVAYVLHPPLLDQGGLRPALQSYVQGFGERTGIHVDLLIEPDIGRLSGEIELVLYRIVQEALSNVHRHSQSASAEILLTLRKSRLSSVVVLSIKDCGKGMPMEPHGTRARRGVGLDSMKARVRQLGGRFKIESAPGRTILKAIVPLRALEKPVAS
jgi:signal transduction histidine kinase